MVKTFLRDSISFFQQFTLPIHKKRDMDFPVVPLHHHPQYKMQCCQLINDEWKRSETARLRSLDASCDDLPTCLILIENNRVIGHCKLSLIPSIKEGCFIESVVIARDLRGQGYGTYLMQKAELYCKDILNLNIMYLSTKGQEQFYFKLGYSVCGPISIYGSFIPAFNNQRQSPMNNVSANLNGTNKKIYMCKKL